MKRFILLALIVCSLKAAFASDARRQLSFNFDATNSNADNGGDVYHDTYTFPSGSPEYFREEINGLERVCAGLTAQNNGLVQKVSALELQLSEAQDTSATIIHRQAEEAARLGARNSYLVIQLKFLEQWHSTLEAEKVALEAQCKKNIMLARFKSSMGSFAAGFAVCGALWIGKKGFSFLAAKLLPRFVSRA